MLCLEVFSYCVMHNCCVWSLSQHTLAFDFMRLLVNHQLGSCSLWFNAFCDMRDSETLLSFPRRALKLSHCEVFSTRKWCILQNKEGARCFSPRMRALTGRRIAGSWPAPRKESYFSYKSNDWKPSLKKALSACRGMIPLVLPTSNPFQKYITLLIPYLLPFLPDQGTAKPTGYSPRLSEILQRWAESKDMPLPQGLFWSLP